MRTLAYPTKTEINEPLKYSQNKQTKGTTGLVDTDNEPRLKCKPIIYKR